MPTDEILRCEDISETVDVAIVGGGVSGAYCAWRLSTAQAFKGKRICLYEASKRIGGRLESVEPPGMPHLRAEVGGMRYLTSHLLVARLVDELQLISKEFPMGDENNLFYLRRRHLRRKDFTDPDKVPYSLDWNEKGKRPDELLIYAIETAVPDAQHKTRAEWLDIKKDWLIDERYLYNIGFWNLLYKILSSEAYNLVLDALGYFSILSNWNAGEALPWLLADFPLDVKYRTLRKGFQQLPKTLVNEFQRHGGTLHDEHELIAFQLPTDDRGLITLTLKDKTAGNDAMKVVQAYHLILAMPKRSLELLDQNMERMGCPNELFSDQFRRALQSVTAQPAFKLFLGYDYPWWQALGLRTGRSGSDLPIRQTYYFGTESEQEGADKRNHNSLLMASYSDGYAVSFWQALAENLPPFEGRTNRFVQDDHVKKIKEKYKVTHDLVEMAHYQLQQIHAIEYYIPKPYMALFKDWRQDPYGGGWHFWNVDVKPWEIIERMRHPNDKYSVYICGEAYSSNQGWVEGALTSAERMLETFFKLPHPSWLPKDYDMGP